MQQQQAQGNNGHKNVQWKGMGEILRPLEGNRGADVLITPTKIHKDYAIATRTYLKDERLAALVYLTIEAFIEDEMWDELNSYMYFLELQLSVKGIGIESFLQGSTGVLRSNGVQGGLKRGKQFNKKQEPNEGQS